MNPSPVKNKQLPLYLIIVASLALAGIFFRLQQASTVSANTGDIQLAESTYPNLVGSRIDTCALCHTSPPSLNPYGAAYKAQGRGLASSLHAIEGVDSDADGFTNLQEIMALTFPGNPADHPVPPTATSTPFQPATSTPTNTRTATPVNTLTSTATQLPATSTPTGVVNPTATRTPTTGVATATRTPSATSMSPSATPSRTTTVRVSRTPTVQSTLRATRIPTCITFKNDDDQDEDDRRAYPDCSHRPNKGGSDSDDHGQKGQSSGEQDSSSRAGSSEDRLNGVANFFTNLWNSLRGGSH